MLKRTLSEYLKKTKKIQHGIKTRQEEYGEGKVKEVQKGSKYRKTKIVSVRGS